MTRKDHITTYPSPHHDSDIINASPWSLTFGSLPTLHTPAPPNISRTGIGERVKAALEIVVGLWYAESKRPYHIITWYPTLILGTSNHLLAEISSST